MERGKVGRIPSSHRRQRAIYFCYTPYSQMADTREKTGA